MSQETYLLPRGYKNHPETRFIQIIDFPENPELPKNADELEAALFDVRSYLQSVTKHKSCPYTKGIEKEGGYYVYPALDEVNESYLDFMPDYTAFACSNLINQSGKSAEETRYLSTILSFHHPENRTKAFCEIIDRYRDHLRLRFLRQGLLISQMHPYHPRESAIRHDPESPCYNSGVPLLVVRPMHRADRIFMKTTEDIRAYQDHFPPKDIN